MLPRWTWTGEAREVFPYLSRLLRRDSVVSGKEKSFQDFKNSTNEDKEEMT